MGWRPLLARFLPRPWPVPRPRLRRRPSSGCARVSGRVSTGLSAGQVSWPDCSDHQAKTPMAAEAVSPDRVYQSRLQVLFGWCGAAVMVGVGIMVLFLPTARSHGGYGIAAIAFIAAVGLARFAWVGGGV